MQYLACVNHPFHKPALAVNTLSEADKDPFLIALGERLKLLRARRGLTRKALAQLAEVSERHVANVESGVGNASRASSKNAGS